MRVPVFVSRSFPTPTGLSPLGESRRISLFPRYEDLVASWGSTGIRVSMYGDRSMSWMSWNPERDEKRSPGMGHMNTGNGGAPFETRAFYFFNFFTFSLFPFSPYYLLYIILSFTYCILYSIS